MRTFSLVVLTLLAGCSSGGGGVDTRPLQGDISGPLAETVNGTPVPQELLEAVARARDLDLAKPQEREQALKLLTDYVLLAQAAQRDNFFAAAPFRADVEAARLQGLGNAALVQLQRQSPITDALVRSEYDAQIERSGKFEYDFAQLLFDNEGDASKAEQEIAGGKAFNEVYDAWRDKAKQAKTFNRVRQDQLPPELAKALADLKAGETTKTAVKTEWGWHVVHATAVNPFVAPPFDQVKDSVRQALVLQIGRERLQKLKEQAKIDYPPGATPPKPDAGAQPASDSALGKAIDAAKKKD
jgi:peptidyl-prolyl cis-trans isomerase C